MYKKFLLLLILLLPIVYGNTQIVSGENYVLDNVSCVGNFLVKVKTDVINSSTDYSLQKCNMFRTNYWFCNCSNELVLVTTPKTNNNYDFTIEYYVESLRGTNGTNNLSIKENTTYNENNKRTKTILNINSVEKIVPPPPPFKINKTTIIGIIISIVILLAIIFSLIGFFVFKSKKINEDELPGFSLPQLNRTDELNKLLKNKK